ALPDRMRIAASILSSTTPKPRSRRHAPARSSLLSRLRPRSCLALPRPGQAPNPVDDTGMECRCQTGCFTPIASTGETPGDGLQQRCPRRTLSHPARSPERRKTMKTDTNESAPHKAARLATLPGLLLVRHPCGAGLVVFEAGSALQIILALIERKPP